MQQTCDEVQSVEELLLIQIYLSSADRIKDVTSHMDECTGVTKRYLFKERPERLTLHFDSNNWPEGRCKTITISIKLHLHCCLHTMNSCTVFSI